MISNQAANTGFEPDSPPASAGYLMAQTEAAKLAAGDQLEQDGKEKEHNRHQKFKDHVNIAVLVLFWTIVVCVLLGLLTFLFHLICPSAWHYLDERQLEKLQTFLGAAVLSSALTEYANKRMT